MAAAAQHASDQTPAEDPRGALCEALLALKDADEARRFLIDLCTPAEVRALSERWHVARLLDEGKLSYRQISEDTGVSTATIVRVARFLKDEPHQGYRAVLDRLVSPGESDRSRPPSVSLRSTAPPHAGEQSAPTSSSPASGGGGGAKRRRRGDVSEARAQAMSEKKDPS